MNLRTKSFGTKTLYRVGHGGLQCLVTYGCQCNQRSDNYSYINVPVLFKYQHSSGLFAETGPQIGFL